MKKMRSKPSNIKKTMAFSRFSIVSTAFLAQNPLSLPLCLFNIKHLIALDLSKQNYINYIIYNPLYR